jgi:hypothetical protein
MTARQRVGLHRACEKRRTAACRLRLQRSLDGTGDLIMWNRSNRFFLTIGAALTASAFACQSHAAVITFTGGTVVRLDATLETTNNAAIWDNVDYYDEGGFRFDFLPNTAIGFSTNIGDYYGVGNDVIHAHWDTGLFGTVTLMEITQIGGGTFDLNFFVLTSNTDTGGAPASGFEQTWVEGFDAFNVSTGPAMLLTPEDWGFPATQINLGPQFDNVATVRFYVTNMVDCFGMDQFFINEIPAPASIALFAGLLIGRRRRQ